VESIAQEMPKEASSFDVEEQMEIAKSAAGKDEFAVPVPPEDEPARQEPEPDAARNNGTTGADGTSVANVTTSTSPTLLVQNGISFFTQLINTLQDPQAVQQLAATITEKDAQTGRTWLKLPVENEKTVEKALHLLASLLNGYGK
jgi:hypothetical protein